MAKKNNTNNTQNAAQNAVKNIPNVPEAASSAPQAKVAPSIEMLVAQGLSEAQARLVLSALSAKGGGRTTPKPCKCGCTNEDGTPRMTKGGVWLPGHDAKHFSKVLAAVRGSL